MTRLASLCLTVALGAGAATVVEAADRLDAPRTTNHPRGYFRVPSDGERGSLEVQGLGPGRLGRLSMLSSWVTSDFLPDDFTTDVLFFDFESLSIVAYFFTDRDNDVRTTVRVTGESGATVFETSFADVAFPGEIVGYIVDAGSLVPGFYGISIRFTQGRRSVGVRYGFRVDDGDPPPGPPA